jgi:hypothetical protein
MEMGEACKSCCAQGDIKCIAVISADQGEDGESE